MTIREFFRTVWQGKYLVVTALVVVLAAAHVYLDRQQVTYEATASVQLVTTDSAPGVAPTTAVDDDPDIVRSPEVLKAAAEQLGETPAVVARAVAAANAEAPGLLLVTARAGSPERAALVANTVAAAYVDHLPTVLEGRLAAIDTRLEGLRGRYETVDQGKTSKGEPKNDALGLAELATIEEQYQSLSGQRMVLDSIRVSGTVAQLVRPAVGAVSLSASSGSVLAIATLVGLVAGVGAAFARRGLDFRVRTTAQATELAELPVLAELFGVTRAVKSARTTEVLPISSRTASPFTESIRELRTAVHVTLTGRGRAVVLVTATDPGAPRSFIAANLAASWALSGRHTVIVQADMRRPELEALLPPPSYWSGDAQDPRPTRVPNLELVPMPHVEMDPADYLATDDARRLVERLRERAEIVVVDAPPVLAAADATILGDYADTAVLLATAGKTDRVVLSEAAGRLRGNNVPLAGIALSGVRGHRRTLYASVYDAAEHDPSLRAPDGRPDAGTDPAEARPETVRLAPVAARGAAARNRGPHWPMVSSASKSDDGAPLVDTGADGSGR